MKPKRIRLLLAGALAVTLTLAWLGPRDKSDIATPLERTGHSRKSVATRAKISAPEVTAATALLSHRDLASNERTDLSGDIVDLFKGFSWYVPPPPPPAPPPPPPVKPTAPQLPFAYLGQYLDGNRQLILLARGDRVVTVTIGEVIDGTYKVQDLTGDKLTFVYLPLATSQTLSTGAAP